MRQKCSMVSRTLGDPLGTVRLQAYLQRIKALARRSSTTARKILEAYLMLKNESRNHVSTSSVALGETPFKFIDKHLIEPYSLRNQMCLNDFHFGLSFHVLYSFPVALSCCIFDVRQRIINS